MGRVCSGYWFLGSQGAGCTPATLSSSLFRFPLLGSGNQVPLLLSLGTTLPPCGFLTPYPYHLNICSLLSPSQVTQFDMSHLFTAGLQLIHLINVFGGLKLNEIMHIKHILQFFTCNKSWINKTLSCFYNHYLVQLPLFICEEMKTQSTTSMSN
jgi:hypothetical protein